MAEIRAFCSVSTFRESSDRWNALFASVRSQLNLEVYYAPCWLAPSPVSSVDARDLEMDAVFNWFAWGGVGESVNVTADADGRVRASLPGPALSA